MREIIIDFTADIPIAPGTIIGRQGENNATALKIKIPTEMLNSEDIEMVSLAAQIGAGYVARSELIAKDETVTVKLDSRMTAVNSLSIQLEGYDSAKSLIVKSTKIDNLIFEKSVSGETPELNNDSDIISSIAANTAARHSHENADVLGKFGENNGVPTYNGQPIASRKTKTAVYDLLEGESYAFVEAIDMRKALLFVINEMTANPIAEGAEILSVEMHFNSDSIPGWVSVDNMNAFDPMTPHIVNHCTAFYESSIGYMCVAALFFPTSGSLFYNALQSDTLDKIRVTFADNEE